MKKTILFLFLYFFCAILPKGLAQSYPKTQKSIDSLKRVLFRSKEDSTQINTLNAISQCYIDMGSYSIADSLARKALALAEKTNYKRRKGESYNKIGLIYTYTSNPRLARDYYMRALLSDEQAVNKPEICRRLRNISNTYSAENKSSLALSYAFKGLKLAERYGLPQEAAGCHNSLSYAYMEQSRYDLAFSHFSKALEINKNPVDKITRYASIRGIADIHIKRGNYYQGLISSLHALDIAVALGNQYKITYALNAVGDVYANMGNVSKAMEYWFKALKIAEETQNREEISDAFASIGEAYLHLKEYTRALDYLLKGLQVANTLADKSFLATNINNLVLVYLGKKDTTTAITYCYKLIELNKNSHIKSYINPALNTLGKIYEARAIQHINKDSARLYSAKALGHYLEALENSKELGQKNQIITSNLILGNFYLNQGETTKAETYLTSALKLSIEVGETPLRKDIYKLLSDVYENKKQCKQQLAYYKQFIALRDTLYNAENTNKMIRSEINFEFEKKLSAERVEQDKKNIVLEAERKRQKTIVWSAIAIALVFFAAGVFAFYNYRQKLKINKELQVRNERIEIAHKIIAEKNHEITDSINYALHIQQAILPDKDEFFKILSKSFILFKPKDIVSGDFYFFSIAHDKIYVAVADCTGHGVPGGFMSMIGSEKLNNALKETSDPGLILTALNKDIKNALHQSRINSKLHDGMDISLCAIDLNSNSIKFAGANRPLWIIRKDSTIIEEIKGTIASIGGYTEDNAIFETHTVQLQQGDTIYLCSDGYADQFGKTGKKLMTKKFKDILTSIQRVPLSEQNKYLEEAHLNWKGHEEQTDDILVIGVQL